MISKQELAAIDCAKRFNYNERALAYRRDRYLAGSFADAADRNERDLYWRAWQVAVEHNARPIVRLRNKIAAVVHALYLIVDSKQTAR